jgi:hypothetical protein
MDSFLQRHIFDILKTDYGKIKIEKFFQDSMFKKINYAEHYRLRLDILFKNTESYERKTKFIKSLFKKYDVKVTFNFKNNNCIIKFYENDIIKWRIEFKIHNLITIYNNITNCYICPYKMDKYETKLLNKKLLKN